MHFIGMVLIILTAWLVFLVISSYRDFCRQWKVKAHGARAPPGFFLWLGHQFVSLKHYERFAGQKGAMNIGGIMMLGIGMVFLAIGFIFLPITTTASANLLVYQYSSNQTIGAVVGSVSSANVTVATAFTGFSSVVGVTPLLILVGFLAAAVITGMMGIKIIKGTGGGAKADPGSLMLIGLSIIFIGIGLIIEPVALDGISSVLHGGGSGISTSFTGYRSILLVSPMLVHLSFIAAAVLSGFFGIKKLSSSSD